MADNKKKKNSAGDARENKTNVFMRRYKRNLIIIFTALIFLFDILLTTAVSYYATNTMNRKISMLMGANTYQQAMNVDSYFNNIKDTSSLFFSDEMYYTYDATQVTDEIEKIEKESVLVDRIRSLGVLENFSDFGIIYADNDSSAGCPRVCLKCLPMTRCTPSFQTTFPPKMRSRAGFVHP